MRLDFRLGRNIPVQQLAISRIAVNVVPCPGPLVVYRTSAASTVTGSLDCSHYAGAIGSPKIRLNSFEAIPSRIRLHRDELLVIATAIGNSPSVSRAAGSQLHRQADERNEGNKSEAHLQLDAPGRNRLLNALYWAATQWQTPHADCCVLLWFGARLVLALRFTGFRQETTVLVSLSPEFISVHG